VWGLFLSVPDVVGEWVLPFGLVGLFAAMVFVLVVVFVRRDIGRGFWRSRVFVAAMAAAGVVLVAGSGVYLLREQERAREAGRVRAYEERDFGTESNLLADPSFKAIGTNPSQQASWVASGDPNIDIIARPAGQLVLRPGASVSSGVIAVRAGSAYRYSLQANSGGEGEGMVRVRLLWLDRALGVRSWDDSPGWRVPKAGRDDPWGFYTLMYTAPDGAARLKLEITSAGTAAIEVRSPKVSQEGVYIEQHPNGARGSLAFSFDWESAMGGAIHSKGMAQHDVASAEAHGIAMRQGADWLAELFAEHGIRATFYATGYNLLDGNTERRTFAGDPVYRWANRSNRWETDWWVTHKWYGDDPYGTAQTDPAWYFGDQTRALLGAGHEIASHTFGHLYVRGAKPQELAADADEWLKAASAVGVATPTTFAFPWRSSNSLTADFYQVLHERGVRAVTRVFPSDMKDLYTLGAVAVYSDVAVMPDFLLGAGSTTMGEENAGSEIGVGEGLRVITQTLTRRGTTSFWQHPEQMAPGEQLASLRSGVRQAWEEVVAAAARERDSGRLFLDTVAEITAFQRDVMSVTASLVHEGDGWKVRVDNALDRPVTGVTLTLPGEAVRATSQETDVGSVWHPDPQSTRVSGPGDQFHQTRQIVLRELKPGSAKIEIEWAAGQEPPR
jgi:peptidoglycan/xylan/chitin deacetylase (PgdA/CDA1 family)